MLNNEADAADIKLALAATSFSAGANNGPWIDVRGYEGDLLFCIAVGARTGTIAFKLQDATDGSGTAAGDITGATLADFGANAAAKIVWPDGANRGYVRLVATVTTGPALIGAVLASRPKSV